MIFIPCREGVSHNPAEAINIDDLVTGTEFLKDIILHLDKQ